MGLGINIGNLKKKVGSSKSRRGITKKPKMGSGVDPAQIIDGGMNIINGLTNLVSTINEQNQRTKQEQERTKQIKIESDERIKTLKMNIELKISKMQDELNKYKEDTKIRIEEMHENTKIEIKNLEIKERELKNIHERNMRLIDQQGKTLDAVLELHTLYYKRKIMGEYVGVDDPREITLVLNNCISNMKDYIKALNSQNNFIEVDYTEKYE